MKVDVGSGGYKRPGYIGLDIVAPGTAVEGNDLPHGVEVDRVCNIETERWPFDDNSVTRLHQGEQETRRQSACRCEKDDRRSRRRHLNAGNARTECKAYSDLTKLQLEWRRVPPIWAA
ncbi:MAG TPA: hypothetical protein VGG12_08485 [Methylovirgula sp.]